MKSFFCQSLSFALALLLYPACTLASGGENSADSATAASQLRSLRAAGAPVTITRADPAYKLIQDLGNSRLDGQAAANELINWVFVVEPPPQTFERIGQLRIHPAARALICLGQAAGPTLLNNLSGCSSTEQAELLLRCIEAIYKDRAPLILSSSGVDTSSPYVTAAIQKVFGNNQSSR